jgi:hypothetical protein
MIKDGIQFTSSVNWCELSSDSKDNYYIARFWKNGDFEWAHNCHRVPQLPKSPLATMLEQAVKQYGELVRCYMGTDDINTRKELFWSIKGKLAA